MIFPPEMGQTARSPERNGVVYTKSWVVDLMLSLAGYDAEKDLCSSIAVEPAAGDGAFVVAMAERLVASCQTYGRSVRDACGSLIAFELDANSALRCRTALLEVLAQHNVAREDALHVVDMWLRTGDYLFDSFRLPAADFVIGNPPYVRLENIPDELADAYRRSYPTMVGRADLYVPFYEAALRQLKPNGVCAFICADRWMLNQYGSNLRNLITSGFSVDAVVEMHDADAFDEDVSAYPAVTVITRKQQSTVVVARLDTTAEQHGGGYLAEAIESVRAARSPRLPVTAAAIPTWFHGYEPWPCGSPSRLVLLRRLEDEFDCLESNAKVGIGVATGLDDVFITTERDVVEPSRLLPLALSRDTLSGHMSWSGHYLVNPWNGAGLVDLDEYPLLKRHFERHRDRLQHRNTAQKNPRAWYRTIDRINHDLTETPKLYIPDIKNEFNPVLDYGGTYPHHNLYWIQSEAWNLEVLGGILLSAVGQFFIECYGVRMRGGYLRFQAQYLRRIRVPRQEDVSEAQRLGLIQAFRRRDRRAATEIALELYRVTPVGMELSLGR